MARVTGQIDARKSEAILEAASDLFAERGAATSMDAIARRAGVSKQTLYNRFGSKTDIGRALAARRSDVITAPLRAGGDPLTVLTALAEAQLSRLCSVEGRSSMRGFALMSGHAPDLALAVYDAGPGESLRRLSLWLAGQDRLGLIRVPDPDLAAEMFIGMATGHGNLRAVLGVDEPRAIDIPVKAGEVARRFLKAFAA